MARRETITIQDILDTAFTMTREEGFSNVTARRVAAKAGCSTQPIFRVYKNMEELSAAIYLQALSFFRDYYSLYPRTSRLPFVNLGMAYISFARKEKYLFELLFGEGRLQKKGLYELLNGEEENVVYEMELARAMGCQAAEELFNRMKIFIHGAACMALTGDYRLTDIQTMELLEQTYEVFFKLTAADAEL